MPCAYSAGSRSNISTSALTSPYPLACASRTARPVPSVVTDPAMYRSVLAMTVCKVSSNRGSAASMSGVYLINGVDIVPPFPGRLRSAASLRTINHVPGRCGRSYTHDRGEGSVDGIAPSSLVLKYRSRRAIHQRRVHRLDGRAHSPRGRFDLPSHRRALRAGPGATAAPTHADWLGLLVDRELTHRRDKRLAARLRYARLRQQASVEDVDYRAPRGLDRALFHKLTNGEWIDAHDNLILCGPTDPAS